MRIVILMITVVSACSSQVVKGVPSPVELVRGKSEMDGERWVVLQVTANSTYKNSIGMAVRPKMQLVCQQHGDEHMFYVKLGLGPLHDVDENARLRIRLGNGDPEDGLWVEASNHSTWTHRSEEPPKMYRSTFASADDNSKTSTFATDDDKSYYACRLGHCPLQSDLKFATRILSVKTILVEFRPFMTGNVVLVRFDVSGLADTFRGSPECKVPIEAESDPKDDFTSQHLEQVSADLKIRLVFSIPGKLGGRGWIERFFSTVNEM
jgi:hypothetical protein